MKIRTLWLDAYGRFLQQTVEFAPGFQVILGPNEQGKTTIRSFIGDMLYGQKRSDNQRVYDLSHTLRRPWHHAAAYGGRMLYVLDDGREIEVLRNFDKRTESVQIFDRTHCEEITAQFPRRRNQEPAFAEAHLGVSKLVFLNAASIGHMEMQDLGDADALGQIREKILSLADSGEDQGSFEAAVAALEARIALIGGPQARSKPLPVLRARVAELDTEWSENSARHQEAAELQIRRRQLLDELVALRAERIALEEETRLVEQQGRAQRLARIEALHAEAEEIQKRCFALSDARDFPVERTPEIQRQHNAYMTAKTALARTEQELHETERQLAGEGEQTETGEALVDAELPEELEQGLVDIEGKIARVQEKLDQALTQAEAARDRQNAASIDLAALPDFGRMASNPIEWLQQLATSFEVECQAREEECRQLATASHHVEQLRTEMEPLNSAFSDVVDFNAEVRAYEIESRVREEQAAQLRSRIDALLNAHRDALREAPRYRNLAFVFVPFIVAFAGFGAYFQNYGAYGPALLGLLGMLWALTRNRREMYIAGRAQVEQSDTEQDLQGLIAAGEAQRKNIEGLLQAASCATVRELEALYERYRGSQVKLDSLMQTLHEQERRVQEKRYQVERLFERLQRTFATLGQPLESEADVRDAASRAIGRYQEYRDAKRRVNEGKDLALQYEAEAERLREELKALQQQDIDLSLDVRRQLRERGFRDENKHTSALAALKAYRIRSAQSRFRRGRADALQERAHELTRQRELEQEDVARLEAALARIFQPFGLRSMEEWNAMAEKARAYREAWETRTRLLKEAEQLLAGQDLDALRQEVKEEGRIDAAPTRNAEEIRRRAAEVTLLIDRAQQLAHDLHIAATQKLAGTRPLYEIEEERAHAVRRRDLLQSELDAALYAAGLIEEVARDKHARVAPRLAETAGAYLAEITQGSYSELFLSRELGITVRIPETASLHDRPEQRLSHGTVDQIYLALRLALVQSLSDAGERIPMLLDDPFANYDDQRLLSAMRLLARLGKDSQIVLFSCREDVARAAKQVGTPILVLP